MRMISSLRRPAPAAAAAPLLELGGSAAEQPHHRDVAPQRPSPGDYRPVADGAGSSTSDRRSPFSTAAGRPPVASSRKTLLASRSNWALTTTGPAAPLAPKAPSLQFSR